MMVNTICIAGAGTMGSGISLVCAQHGFKTLLFDVNEQVLDKAQLHLQQNIQQLIAKQKITAAEGEKIYQRIHFISVINDCVADLFIEAIIEKIETKVALFNQLAAINTPDTIFASNTSSLSISAIQKNMLHPQRVAGMHFFNPPAVMKLVEVISGNLTSEATTLTINGLCKKLGKQPVLCKDSPGFIVNRVARHYYLEAMKIAALGIASIEDIDAIMEANGFKMGPFKLMDLIGIDINLAVSQSLYDSFHGEERFTPSPLQIEKVKNGELGKKTGKGFYNYDQL